MFFGIDQAKNYLKVWKKTYGQIVDIRTFSKFKWDDDKKMIVVEVKELEDWSTYCKNNRNAKQYANKIVEHWDDICMLVGPDRATGGDIEQIEDSATAMNMEGPNDEESGRKGTYLGSNK